MKNITIAVEDDLYRAARIRAAEQSTSISAMFKSFLLRQAETEEGETQFQRLQREEAELRAEMRAERRSLNPAHNLSREKLHIRHALH